MPPESRGRDLLVIDNSIPGQTGLRHLEEWASIAWGFDFATGTFEIGAPPALDNERGELTEEAGSTRWHLVDLDRDVVLEEPADIVAGIRSRPGTPRHCIGEQMALVEIRARVEKHFTNTYLQRVDAPVGVKPALKCGMELS